MTGLIVALIILSFSLVGIIHAIRFFRRIPGYVNDRFYLLTLKPLPKATVLSLALISPLLVLLFVAVTLYQINPVQAQGDPLTLEILAGYNLVVDSNVTTPATYGPSAATVAGKVCNISSNPLTDVVVYIGDSAGNTPGIYPARDSSLASFIAQHPDLANSGLYSFTHEGGSLGLDDATRQIGVLPAGECTVQYWLFSYPRCEDNEEPPCSEDPVWGAPSDPDEGSDGDGPGPAGSVY